MPKAYLETVASPAGPLSFAVNEQGALIRLHFEEGNYSQTLEQWLRADGFTIGRDSQRNAQARQELAEYATGQRQVFEVPVVFEGSDWQVAVWQALTKIPFGQTRSYGQLAVLLGQNGAARAVGRANATNKLPLVVPCHRVIGASGALTGFAGGLHLKTRLLDHEKTVLAKFNPVETQARFAF